jgi:hypothetical protein
LRTRQVISIIFLNFSFLLFYDYIYDKYMFAIA